MLAEQAHVQMHKGQSDSWQVPQLMLSSTHACSCIQWDLRFGLLGCKASGSSSSWAVMLVQGRWQQRRSAVIQGMLLGTRRIPVSLLLLLLLLLSRVLTGWNGPAHNVFQ
jgi:hypothetical protein